MMGASSIVWSGAGSSDLSLARGGLCSLEPESAVPFVDRSCRWRRGRGSAVNWGRPVRCDDRHEAAVANTLRWADDAAARGDHADAVSWVETVLAIGDELPEE